MKRRASGLLAYLLTITMVLTTVVQSGPIFAEDVAEGGAPPVPLVIEQNEPAEGGTG